MQTIALRPVPNQQVQVSLGGQQCQIKVYEQGSDGQLYLDLTVAGQPISLCTPAYNMVNTVPSSYFGFTGTLAFLDTQGTSNPQSSGLGSRWQLLWLIASDFANV